MRQPKHPYLYHLKSFFSWNIQLLSLLLLRRQSLSIRTTISWWWGFLTRCPYFQECQEEKHFGVTLLNSTRGNGSSYLLWQGLDSTLRYEVTLVSASLQRQIGLWFSTGRGQQLLIVWSLAIWKRGEH